MFATVGHVVYYNLSLFYCLLDNLQDNPDFGHYLAELSSYRVERLSMFHLLVFLVNRLKVVVMYRDDDC
jgi:hypothetical protein